MPGRSRSIGDREEEQVQTLHHKDQIKSSWSPHSRKTMIKRLSVSDPQANTS